MKRLSLIASPTGIITSLFILFCTTHFCSAETVLINHAIVFNGAGKIISPIDQDLKTLTIEFFFKTKANGGLVMENDSDNPLNIWIEDGIIYATLKSDGTGITSTGSLVNDDYWHHLALSIALQDTGNYDLKLYIDGDLNAEASDLSWKNYIEDCTLYFGYASRSETNYLTGYMDDIRVWSTNRTAAEINHSSHYFLTGEEENLLTCYPFERTAYESDSVYYVYDRSKNGKDGQLDNLTTDACQTISDLPVNSAQTSQYAISFDGSGDYLEIGSATNSIDLYTSSFTIEFWAQRDDSGNDNYIISQGKTSLNNGLNIGFTSSDVLAFSFWGNDLQTTNTYTDHAWHHWACVYEYTSTTQIGKRYIYKDGTLAAQDSSDSSPYMNSGKYTIGSYFGSKFFKGQLDEIRFWQSARTQEDIQDNMSVRLAGTETGLAGYWRFDERTGTTFTDKTGNGFDATLTISSGNNADDMRRSGPWTDNISESGTEISGEFAIQFDGTQGLMAELENTPMINLTDEFTASAWIFLGQDNTNDQLIMGNNAWALVRLCVDNKVAFTTTGFESETLTGTTKINTGIWTHVAVSWDGNTKTIYINGYTDTTATSLNDTLITSTSNLTIGSYSITGNELVGSIDDVRIWTSCRSYQEIASDYSSALRGNETDLAAYLRFNRITESTSGDFSSTDLTGNGYTAMLTGFQAKNIIDGKILSSAQESDYALYFDGVDDYVTTSDISLDSDSGFSIEFWARRASDNKQVCLISQSDHNSITMVIGFTKEGYFYSTINNTTLTSDDTYSDFSWHHWACVYTYDSDSNESEWTLYRDAEQIAQSTPDISYSQQYPITLGKDAAIDNYYHGWMDELRIWSRQLSIGEISYLQDATQSGGYPNLSAYWGFDEAFASTDIDLSDNGRVATLFNMNTENERPQGIVHQTSQFPLAFTTSPNPSTAGLWFGTIEVNKVCEVHASSNDAQTPTETPYSFSLPVILHVDSSGTVNLLSEVTIMQYPMSSEKYGERVLITDQDLLSNYEGIIRRNGKLVGARMTSPAFPMEYSNGELETAHLMTGGISLGGSIATTLYYGKDHPTNPYRHHYHPDADEGFEITRTITLTFDEISEADQVDDPDLGVSRLTGVYNESVSGLHKATIYSEGTFSLNWINDVSTLNP